MIRVSAPVSVSIVTPCYNGARFIRDTLLSAVAQSRPPLEVLVVDDGSTDDSAAIAESIGPPVRVMRQSNKGESVARNRALAEAQGTHVLFLDADDLLEPDALARLSDAVQGRAGVVALMGCGWFTSDPATPHQTQTFEHRTFFPDIIASNFAPPNCWLAPLDVIRRAGSFSESMKWFEDWDLWWRVGLEASGLVMVPYVGAKYRQHPQSQLATTKADDRARGHAVLMTRMATSLLRRPDLLAAHGEPLFWSAWTAIRRAREAGVAWQELAPLSAVLRELARRGPGAVTRIRTAKVMRWLGVRTAMAVAR